MDKTISDVLEEVMWRKWKENLSPEQVLDKYNVKDKYRFDETMDNINWGGEGNNECPSCLRHNRMIKSLSTQRRGNDWEKSK